MQPIAAWLAAFLIMGASGCARAPVGATPAAAPGEALVLPEHYAHSIAAVGMPGAQRAFQIGSGSVVGNGDAALEWRLISGSGAVRISPVYFERDGVPVAHWWMVSDRESVHFEAAAAPRSALGDTSLMLSVAATATWLDPRPGECALEMRVRARPAGPTVFPWDAENTETYAEAWNARFAVRNGRIVAGVDPALARTPRAPATAPTRGPGPGVLVAIGRARLARGEQHRWHYWMPAYPSTAPGAGLERLATHANVVADARNAWRGWLAKSAQFATPDSLINQAWRAGVVTLVLCQERARGEWVPIGNPFQYRDVWLRDGARTVRALAVAGLTDLARSDAWTLTRFQLPSGAFLSQQGQIDGTGQALWALAQAATLPGSSDLATRAAPLAKRAVSWIEIQRLLTRQLEIKHAGLLPLAEPRDNELVRAQLVGNDAWGIAGCRAAEQLARLAGDEDLARTAASAAANYRGAFRAALLSCGSPDVPASWQNIGRDWGNLAVCYPTGVMAADDPRLAALARRVRARIGSLGLVSHWPLDTLHTYVGTDLAQWSLLAGRPAEARAYLADLLAHSSSTLGQAELFHRGDNDFGTNMPPHSTAAAGLLDLLRNMVISDTRDTLELALGGDPAWWHGTRVTGAPTRFGIVDVSLDSSALDHRRAQWSPVAAPTRVRVADGERAVEALTAGARVVGERWIMCPPNAREVEFRVAPAHATTPGGRP